MIRNVHTPHQDFETFIRSIANLSQELQATAPTGPAAAARFAVLWGRPYDLIRPADLPMKIGFPILRAAARVARLAAPAQRPTLAPP